MTKTRAAMMLLRGAVYCIERRIAAGADQDEWDDWNDAAETLERARHLLLARHEVTAAELLPPLRQRESAEGALA